MLKVGLISASPKMTYSASENIIDELKTILDQEEGLETGKFYLRRQEAFKEDLDPILDMDVLVFAFPLYVDGIPAHILRALKTMDEDLKKNPRKSKTIYAIANAGFYEGIQNQWALEILENWAIRQGFQWGQGIGLGAGGMLLGVKNIKMGQGPKINLYKALKDLSKNIKEQVQAENLYIEMNFPRFLYKIAAESSWRKKIKMHGLRVKDLNHRCP